MELIDMSDVSNGGEIIFKKIFLCVCCNHIRVRGKYHKDGLIEVSPHNAKWNSPVEEIFSPYFS